ncbi:hypothetical protein D3C72_1582520 [compost metagenome]
MTIFYLHRLPMCILKCNLGIEFPFFTVRIVKYHDLIGLTRKIPTVDLLSILLISYFMQPFIQIQFSAIGGKGFINIGVKANKKITKSLIGTCFLFITCP